MKKFVYIVFGALLLVGCTADLKDQMVSGGDVTTEKILNSSESAIQGAILVRFNPMAESRLTECATRSGATRTGVEGVDALLDVVGGSAVEQVFVVNDKNREKVYERGLHLWYELRFNEESNLDNVATELAKVAEVERVQFLHRVCRTARPTRIKAEANQSQSSTETRAIKNPIPFNDLYRTAQWSLKNLGSGSEVSDAGYVNNLPKVEVGADINIIPAWNLCKGDPSIVVAVVDEAVMYDHEDLASNMWVNSGEIADDNIDNDGNGYKDDVYGFNFVRLDSNLKWTSANDSGHGTHVAGIISAVNNNGIGICGIAGGDGTTGGVRIMSVQIFYGTGTASNANTAKGIQYAADNGAHILQCSWGYESALVSASNPANDAAYKKNCRLEAEALDYFVANGGDDNGPLEGGLVIFAAGNDGKALTAYPAAYQPCIAVASINPALRPAYYTDYGTGTDIAAPGGEMLYNKGSILSCVPAMFQDAATPNYCEMQGTSQACPHVSGVAALGLSYAKKLGKRYTATEFRSMILSATNDIEPYLTGSISIPTTSGVMAINYPSYKAKLGAGYVDAYKLLLQIDGTPYTVVKSGSDEIDLAPYFGDGVYNAKLQKIELSDEDKANVGLGDCTYSNGKLTFNCSKSGVATVKITLLVGGGSMSDSKYPYPVEVAKSFVVMVREGVTSNGGWL